MCRFVLQNASRLVPTITVDVVDKYVCLTLFLLFACVLVWVCMHMRVCVCVNLLLCGRLFCLIFKPPPPIGAGGGYMFSGRPSMPLSVHACVRPSMIQVVVLCFRDISSIC